MICGSYPLSERPLVSDGQRRSEEAGNTTQMRSQAKTAREAAFLPRLSHICGLRNWHRCLLQAREGIFEFVDQTIKLEREGSYDRSF
jgi:hypothetical protein